MSSKTDSVAFYKMRKILAELSTKKGRGTELVSLYIPPKRPLHEVSGDLKEEYNTASNIKSDVTRTHVQDALVKIMQRLKLYDKTPENGLAIFCGALPSSPSAPPGSEVLQLYEVLPHKPIQNYLYRCDDHFHLEPLIEMMKEEKTIGIISIDNTETGLGIVTGNRVDVIDVVTSGVSGKHRAGGQSARRFERLREAEINDYFNRVARHATKVFLEQYSIKGLILGGPGPTKDYFLKGEYLDYRLQNNVLAVVDTSYSGREGIRETIERAESVLKDLRIIEEKELVKKFLSEVSSDKGLVVYGVNEVIDSLKKGNAHTVLVSEDIGLIYLQAVCKKCGMIKEVMINQENLISEKQKLISEACSSCGSNDIEIIEKDFIDFLVNKAMDLGAKVEVISSKSEEGVMFKSFGGVGALLRYR
ncbi:MAG: peptide chain release factor aRF-1 [archaeon]|nr:peptide chain release factor aRF-1 [archaeon]MCP8319454.1 peptide chain release factor aRF-1 [archaeon]